jgi:hypothetical protein
MLEFTSSFVLLGALSLNNLEMVVVRINLKTWKRTTRLVCDALRVALLVYIIAKVIRKK